MSAKDDDRRYEKTLMHLYERAALYVTYDDQPGTYVFFEPGPVVHWERAMFAYMERYDLNADEIELMALRLDKDPKFRPTGQTGDKQAMAIYLPRTMLDGDGLEYRVPEFSVLKKMERMQKITHLHFKHQDSATNDMIRVFFEARDTRARSN